MQPLKFYRDLNKEEKKNVYLAVAAGALQVVHDLEPGPLHKRRKRVLHQLRKDLLEHAVTKIPPVREHNIDLFRDTIKASETVLLQILNETGQSATHVLLNLVGFCMEKLPLVNEYYRRYGDLFDMWPLAQQYKDVRSGDRIFSRIDSEMEILVAQRGGILL